MQISFRGKNVEASPALRQHAEKKLGKLTRYFDKYLDGPLTAQVSFAVERGRHIVEVTIPVNGMLLRGEERSDDMYVSVDRVVDKLEKQIDRYKTRFGRKGRPERGTAGGRLGRQAAAGVGPTGPDGEAGELEGETAGEIVRVKRFALKPMDPEDAVMQMNLLGHSFFVFLNATTEQVNVVYRRDDGRYGLIEPAR